MTAAPEKLAALRQWVAKAEEDLRAAEILLREADAPLSGACFHAQQSVEKYVKALLADRDIPFRRAHDVGELVALLPSELHLPITPEDQERLTHYAVATRYPGHEPVTREEAASAVAAARETRAAIRALLPPEALAS